MSTPEKRKKWFERNEQAEALEAEGRDDEALRLYLSNDQEGCDLAFTYERMAAIYRRQERYDDELRALERALFIERKRGPTTQLVRLQRRIDTTNAVRERSKTVARDLHVREVSEPVRREDDAASKQKTGCLSVLVLCAASAALLFALA